jgi:hypothetical protein
VVRRDDRVEFTTHCAHEHRIGRKRPIDAGHTRGWREESRVFAAESSAVATVWIERAQCDARGFQPKPLLKSIARDARGFDDRVRAQFIDDAAERNVGRRQNDAQLVGGEHHRNARSGKPAEHLGVTGKIVAAGVQRRLVDRSGHDSLNRSVLRHGYRSLDRQAAQVTSDRGIRARRPASDRLGDIDTRALGTDDHNVTALADPWVSERFSNDLRTNSAGIAHGHGKTHFHRYILRDT